jgi:hypothetical protein
MSKIDRHSDFTPSPSPHEQRNIMRVLAEWQHHWNWHRPHTALGGLSPIDRVCERIDKTPLWETVEAAYDRTRERIRIADYRLDKALDELK